MDLQPQASFIPKRPLTSAPVSGSGAPSILWIVSVFVFIVSVIAAIAVFGYILFLQKSIQDSKDSLSRAQAAYDPTSIDDLIRLNERIEQAKLLLNTHTAPSAVFDFLEQKTLATVRFTKFDYVTNPDASISITLTGNAIDFASVALQSDQFGAAVHTLKNVLFSGINIDPTTGIVGFQVAANFNPDAMRYDTQLAGNSQTSSSDTSHNSLQSTSGSATSSPGTQMPASQSPNPTQ